MQSVRVSTLTFACLVAEIARSDRKVTRLRDSEWASGVYDLPIAPLMYTKTRPDTSESLADTPTTRVAYSLHDAAAPYRAPAQRSDDTTANLPARRLHIAGRATQPTALAGGTVNR